MFLKFVAQSRMASFTASFRAAARDRHDLRTVHFHGRYVRLLAANVNFAHVHDAFEAEFRAGGGSSKPVLTGTRLRDNAGLAHLLGQEALADGVIDLVGSGVGEAFELDVNLRTAQKFGRRRGEVQRSLAANVVTLDNAEFFEEFRIVDVLVECRFKVVERAADDFGNVLAAELVKETVVRGYEVCGRACGALRCGVYSCESHFEWKG